MPLRTPTTIPSQSPSIQNRHNSRTDPFTFTFMLPDPIVLDRISFKLSAELFRRGGLEPSIAAQAFSAESASRTDPFTECIYLWLYGRICGPNWRTRQGPRQGHG